MDQQELDFEENKFDESYLPNEQRPLLVELMAQVILTVYHEQYGEDHEQCD